MHSSVKNYLILWNWESIAPIKILLKVRLAYYKEYEGRLILYISKEMLINKKDRCISTFRGLLFQFERVLDSLKIICSAWHVYGTRYTVSTLEYLWPSTLIFLSSVFSSATWISFIFQFLEVFEFWNMFRDTFKKVIIY